MSIKHFRLFVVLSAVLSLLSLDSVVAQEQTTTDNYIIISKEHLTLTLYNGRGEVVVQYPVAVGKNYGNKQRIGDYRTPEGEFTVRQVQDAKNWGHDFGDGKGFIEHCYGNWFIRLHTPPHTGIGIHGTHTPESIGTRATEGCVRMRDEDLDALRPYIELGMRVVIEPSQADIMANKDIAENPQSEAKPVEREVKEEATSKPAETKATESTTAVGKSAESRTSGSGEDVWHTVADGDLVSKIAYQYGTTVSKIKALNPNINIDRISVGQRIKVKGTPERAAENKPQQVEQAKPQTQSGDKSSQEVWYTVADGDYLGKIAQKHRTTISEIKKLNPNLNVDRLSIGQRIRVK